MHQLILDAQDYLKGKILTTPVEHSAPLSGIAGVPVWLKLEHLQRTGSFKLRGAWFRLAQIPPGERAKGVLTCSAGNHGKGVAYASRELGIRAVICVPSSVDKAKLSGMQSMGAEVRVSSFPGYDDTEIWARSVAEAEGLPFISAFDDPYVMAGNGGTLALEVTEQLPDVREFLVPVGGGGLAAGFVSAMPKGARAIGCQLQASPALALSLQRGHAVTALPAVETLARGLEGGIGAGPFEIIRRHIHEVALVTEAEIIHATRWMLEEHQYLIEPSAAVAVAALLANKAHRFHGPVCALICGRNVAIETLRRIA
ncbi:MAG: pyridoxal-phosphate dependent enzyme [Acidobacteria bacterium]|nr:pyridoxal-phosphate dependent enzyme [Acidobacteriota bacterium]